MKLGISCLQESQLIFQMAVNGALHGFGTNPDHVAPTKRGQEAEQKTSEAPKRHDPTRLCVSGWHGFSEQAAMIDLVFPHLLKSAHDVRKQPAGHPYLRSVDANSAKLTGVIDLENTPNGESWIVFTGTAGHSKHYHSAFQSNQM